MRMIGVHSVSRNGNLSSCLTPCFGDPLLMPCLGAFVAAPVGGLLWGFAAFAVRIGFLWALAKYKGKRFDALDRPPPMGASEYVGGQEATSEDDQEPVLHVTSQKGRFF